MLQRSPVRRSARLQSDAGTAPTTLREPMQPASENISAPMQPASENRSAPMQPASENRSAPMQPASKNRSAPMQPASDYRSEPMQPASENRGNETEDQHAKSTSKQPAKSNEVPTLNASHAVELQTQIDALRRQLIESNAKLSSSQRQCQQLQSALRCSNVLPTPNNPGSPSYLDIQLETSFSGHAASTTCTPLHGFSAENSFPAINSIAAISNTPLAAVNSIAAISNAPLATINSIAANSNAPLATINSIATNFNAPLAAANSAANISLPTTAQACSTQQMRAASAASAASSSNTCTLPFNNSAAPPFCISHLNQPSAMNPRKLQDLPEFSGQPEDWPTFYTAFSQSTIAYAYTNLENHQRLLKCLKGDARETIKSLLIHPDNIAAVIDQLRFRFGRPEQLIQSQLRQVRELTHVSEQNLAKIIPFATKVKNLCAFLQSVNGQQHIANPTLLEELVAKLPMSKKIEWARIAVNIQPYPTIVDFSAFISDIANLICTVQASDHREPKRSVLLSSVETSTKCLLCQGNHKLQECERFLNLSINERWAQLKKLRACFSCLCRGHGSRNCRRKRSCQQDGCHRHHHKLLHENMNVPKTSTESSPATTDVHQNVLSCLSPHYKRLLFRILPVTLYGENRRINVYALFDEGSSITMLDKTIAQELGVRGKSNTLNIQWIGGRSAQENSTVFNVKVRGLGKRKSYILRDVHAVSNLNLPVQSVSESDIRSAFRSSNAPFQPYSNVVPHLLIGLDHVHLGLPMKAEKVTAPGPVACNTKLGWVVYGPCRSIPISSTSCLFVKVENDNNLHELVDNFFNIESIGVRAAPTVENSDDLRAQKILKDTTRKVGDRFETGLLWKSDQIKLPDSYDMALSRLINIERKMMRDEHFAKAYKDVLQSYIQKGYARKVSPADTVCSNNRKWYLPHFGVLNPNKPKKIRLVFDAAAQVGGVCLNSHLLKGPQDIELLPSILFNFRRGKIAVCADIREMYHQILIRPEDRISQRFLWRDCDRQRPPEEYEMRVMTFGAACSPCSARHVLKVNAYEHEQYSSRAVDAIIKHHYIDDFVDSFDNEEEALRVSKEVQDIHKDGGFELRSFISNSARVRISMGGSDVRRDMLANEATEKVLGVYWESSSDTLKFHIKFHKISADVTSDRMEPHSRPFKNTGLDYFGPVTVSIGRRVEKRWVALFTCLTIRAIHLEVAHDLSTDSCIIAMRNFMNRRGVPARLRSDNGKNFVGASEEAKRFCEVFEPNRIQEELSSKGIEWIFNCPMNPSEGGAWERMVQCVKRVIRHTIKDTSPKEHVLQALLIEAENIVNSRPLTHLPVSVHEEDPLTPNHFLIGLGNVAQTPDVDEQDEKLCRLRKQWRIIKSLRDRFWKRWVLEYLPTLTRRVKWCKATKPIKEQDLVFICDLQLPRSQWRRGIVVQVYCGVDGVARRADVKTSNGVLRRAVSKLAVLDVDSGEADRFTEEGML